jgi:hypothetical protein
VRNLGQPLGPDPRVFRPIWRWAMREIRIRVLTDAERDRLCTFLVEHDATSATGAG